jgi:hypothetical protein
MLAWISIQYVPAERTAAGARFAVKVVPTCVIGMFVALKIWVPGRPPLSV